MAATAGTRLEVLQVYKLLQCVRQEDTDQIFKLCNQGIPKLVNYREPEEGECALHLAAKANNSIMAKFLLDMGALTDVKDFKGQTPIMKAAEYGHEKTVELLAEKGADMTIRDEEGKDVVFYCMSPTARHKHCLNIVLSHSADLNNITEVGDSALSMACQNAEENQEMCLMLLEKGANPNAVNKITGRSTLSMACDSNCEAVIKALLSHGADPNVIDKKSRSPLHFAAQMGVFNSVKSLVSYGANCNVVDKDGNNPLHNAAENGFGNICKYLAQRGCNPKLKNADGFTPRLLAKEKSHKDAGKELRKAEHAFTKYSKPGMKNPNEPELVVFYDWIHERQEVVRENLIKEMISPSQGGDDPALSKGNFVYREDFERAMVKLEAPPLEEDQKKRFFEVHDRERRGVLEIEEFISGKKYIGKTYLVTAFEGKKKKRGKKSKKGRKGKRGKKSKIPMPICVGDEGPRRPDGGPPIAFVEKQIQWTDTTRFNRDRPPKHPLEDDSAWYIHPPERQFVNITEAAKLGDMESLKTAFKNGIPVDTRDKYFKTPLMAAAAAGHYALTRFLLSMGASVDARDNFKWTALHHACHSGQVDVVKELAYAGSDLNAVTWNGASTLMRAVEGGQPDVVRFLLDCGVNILQENKKEKSALDVARDWADNEIYWMIRDAYEAAPKPKKDKKPGGKKKPAGTATPKPLTIPPIPQGHLTAPAISASDQASIVVDEFDDKENAQPAQFSISDKVQEHSSDVKRVTILDFASSLASGGMKRTEDVVYTPRKVWNEEPTTADLKKGKAEKRARFGFEIDFDTYEKPLEQSINRVTQSAHELKDFA